MTPVRFLFAMLAFFGVSAGAQADDGIDYRKKFFEMDKASALASFGKKHRQSCVETLQTRYQSGYALAGDVAFNEAYSLAAYDQLFWKGSGDARRGLIFTAPVNDTAGKDAGNLICYYAVTDGALDFQSAYVLARQPFIIASKE